MFILIDRQIELGDWYVIVTAVLLIFTVIRNPEGVVGPAHAEMAARRLARLTAEASAAAPVEEAANLEYEFDAGHPLPCGWIR